MKNSHALVSKFLAGSLLVAAVLSLNYLSAWTGSGSNPPAGNIFTPINAGATSQVKVGALGVNTLAVFGDAYVQGNVGVGFYPAEYLLDIDGGPGDGIRFPDGSVQTTAYTGRSSSLPPPAPTNPAVFSSAGTYSFTVPTDVTSITVRAWGASGGTSGGSSAHRAGGGGYVKGTISVAPGAVFKVIVGGGGKAGGGSYYAEYPTAGGAGGYAGGGAGGAKGTGTASGAGGGGFSGVFVTSTTTPILLAAGGGGQSIYSAGAGGGTTGQLGGGYTRATGGTQSAGGTCGCGAGASYNGAAFQGGTGVTAAVAGRWGGGGGGGGYFGGGGGWYGSGSGDSGDGGAGGSSYTGGSGSYTPTSVVNTGGAGYLPGNTADAYWNGTAGVGPTGTAPANGADGEVVISW